MITTPKGLYQRALVLGEVKNDRDMVGRLFPPS